MSTNIVLNMDDYCYKFSGKAFEAYRGMNRYDFHARQYDPALGLFDRPDPLDPTYTSLNVQSIYHLLDSYRM